jgi:hypothetical protein
VASIRQALEDQRSSALNPQRLDQPGCIGRAPFTTCHRPRAVPRHCRESPRRHIRHYTCPLNPFGHRLERTNAATELLQPLREGRPGPDYGRAIGDRPRDEPSAQGWRLLSMTRELVGCGPLRQATATAAASTVASFSLRTMASPIVSTVSSRRTRANAGSRLWVLLHDRQRRARRGGHGAEVMRHASAWILLSHFKPAPSSARRASRQGTPEANAGHIFREAPGHLGLDTPENRQLIENTANNPANYVGTNSTGVARYRQLLRMVGKLGQRFTRVKLHVEV